MNFRVLTQKRILLSRIMAAVLMSIFLFTRTEIKSDVLKVFLDNLGLFFISVGALGRIWSSLYICGHKTVEIIDQGPYSAVRNPLYLFSFIGVVGIALSTGNWIFMTMILTLFLVYYPFVIIGEEKKLIRLHGERFNAYMHRTPRFFPALRQLAMPATYEVDVKRFSKAFLDAVWFFVVYILIEGVKFIHAKGLIPVVFSL
jgi:protein-S-isoprenylcysteine O-methyltransferase Ste14